MQSPLPEFSQSEIEGLQVDRKRWLANAYISMGIPLQTTYNGKPQEINGEASTTETINSSLETFTAYHSQQNNAQSPANAQPEVRLSIWRNLKYEKFTI